MMSTDLLARARDVLVYDPEAGTFRHAKARVGNRMPEGAIAGSLDRNGYRRVSVGKVAVLEHRLAWAMHFGAWPLRQIDHIDGCRSNNAIRNLRDVDASTNQQNRQRAQGSSGFLWVSWKRREERWRAAFQVRGVTVTVGHFASALEAHKAALARRCAMGLSVPARAEGAPDPQPASEAAHG